MSDLRMFLAVAAVTSAALTASPVQAQASEKTKVIYCGIGVQGALADFAAANPYTGQFYRRNDQRTGLNKALLAGIPAEAWQLDVQPAGEGKGSDLGLSHVIAYEKVDEQSFVDPVDQRVYYNTSYAIGFNTVLFDLASKQVRALVPAILRFNTTTPAPQGAAQRQQAFDTMLRDTSADGAIGQFLASIRALPMRFGDKASFQVLPVTFSDGAQQRLAAQNLFDSKGADQFSRRATSVSEALLALQFAKPMVPANSSAPNAGQAGAATNQYVATIPECLGQAAVSFAAPLPAYQLRITVDELRTANFEHQLPTADGQGAAQVEMGFGGRFRAEILAVQGPDTATVLDDRSFGYARSLRFLGPVKLDAREEYLKLTAAFVKELLTAYASQDQKWIKEHLSAAIADKKERNPGQISKQWKDLFMKRIAIPAVK
ncbi:MAG: hypothetical protein WCO11_11090 [Sphingomonadales bacterium]|jgi:hypothetical protein